MTEKQEPLEGLHTRLDSLTRLGERSDAWAAHEVVLDRLASNIRVAQARGWTSCAIERFERSGRFSAWGVPPGDCERHPVPDSWTEADDTKAGADGD